MATDLNYSGLDRLLHRIAFSSPAAQIVAADVEKLVLRKHYAAATANRPIFVTSLPRAGTTLLLEVLSQFPQLASQSYRDMPFVLAPLLWSRLSSIFRKRSELSERAHKDGMQIGFDSPEAFEEIFWRAYWPEKYSDDRIDLWHSEDGKADAQDAFAEHMKKVVALYRQDRIEDGRYLSKNNANIARLELIEKIFPDAQVVVPIREPVAHAASLLRQHENFTLMHAKEPFVLRYMADLGHYEFGHLHRPISFPEIKSLTADRDPATIDYWLAYWISAFNHILDHKNNVILVSYEDACADSFVAVSELCDRLDIVNDGALVTAAGLINQPQVRQSEEPEVDSALLRRARDLHKALCDEAI